MVWRATLDWGLGEALRLVIGLSELALSGLGLSGFDGAGAVVTKPCPE